MLREVVVQGTCLLPAHLPRKLACSAGAGELGSPNAPTPAKAGELPTCESLAPAAPPAAAPGAKQAVGGGSPMALGQEDQDLVAIRAGGFQEV